MSTLPEVLNARVRAAVDSRTLELIDSSRTRRRGWLIRRALLCADLLGIVVAFVAT